MKIAFDENIPKGMINVFQVLSEERQFQRLLAGITIHSAANYSPKLDDPDYSRKNDVPWLTRFAQEGGKVVISGDLDMHKRPHECLALRELGLITIFFASEWSKWDFFRKSAFLLNWWLAIATKIKVAKPGTFWIIPLNWRDKGKLRQLNFESYSISKTNPDIRVRIIAKKTSKKSQKQKRGGKQGVLDL